MTLLSFSILALVFSCQPSQVEKKPLTTPPPVYKDGIYSASYDEPNNQGWKGFLEVQVRDKMIVSANFDYISKTGALLSQDQAYADNMKKTSGITPSDAARALLDSLVDSQTAEVAVIPGAKEISETFKALSQAALTKAAQGDTSPTLLPQTDKAPVVTP